jgi:ribosomal protein S18 acetylase RimI-like enzyme
MSAMLLPSKTTPENQYIPGIARLTKEVLGNTDIMLNAWSLQEIGVLPEYQKRGIGTSMFKFVDSQVGCLI